MVSTPLTMKLQSRLHKQKVFYSLSGCRVKCPGEGNTIKMLRISFLQQMSFGYFFFSFGCQ